MDDTKKLTKPLKFASVEELQAAINAYFAECDPHMVEAEEWEELRDKEGKLIKDKNGYNKLVLTKRKRMTKQIPYTITGLAMHLTTTRQTLLEYEGEVEGREKSPEYADTIKAAKLKCENFNEQQLYGPSPTGTIFNLKNNYGWRDQTQQDLTHSGNVQFINDMPRPPKGSDV